MINVGIIGATGYAGIELYRLLQSHKQVIVIAMGSRAEAGQFISDKFPNLLGICELKFVTPTANIFNDCNIIFFATPHGVAMHSIASFIKQGIKIIDLGADFRIKNTKVWSQWYGMEHTEKELLKNSVYGLPEIYAQQIKNAQLIANPGCYPTAIMLGLKPLLENNLIDTTSIITDCKSGVSGAGRKAQIDTLLCESSENLKAYGVNHHRHKPEIEQELSLMANKEITIIFVPHLIPMQRGMLITIYANLISKNNIINLQKLFTDCYQSNDLVYILKNEQQPQTSSVIGTNNCQIAIKQFDDKLIITTVIDNLIKGASGQAVQNMNLMFGLKINSGLTQIANKP